MLRKDQELYGPLDFGGWGPTAHIPATQVQAQSIRKTYEAGSVTDGKYLEDSIEKMGALC